MTTWNEIERLVEERAGGRCEYCLMHQSLQGATFHVEHIVPKSRSGLSIPENLAWACPGCNLHKSNRVLVPDPDKTGLVPLFNPRLDNWNAHFRWENYRVLPLTAIGRATVAALNLNRPRRIRIRQAEETFGLFPPS